MGSQVKLGTLTITGYLPIDLSGGKSNFEKKMRYTLTQQGYVRGGKLYKTFDPQEMLKASGLVDAAIASQSFVKL